MPSPSKRRLTASEFADLHPLLTRMTPERIEIARLAIVDGRSMPSIGTQYGCTKQSVADAITIVWREAEKYRESQRVAVVNLPPGWEQVTLIAPSRLVKQFRDELNRATMRAASPRTARKNQASKSNNCSELLTN